MDFSQVAAEFRQLKAQYEAGTLNEIDFKARLQDLMVQDEAGRWWMIGYETGQWYVHDGEQWVQAEPPESQAPATVQPVTPAPPPDRAGAVRTEQAAEQRKPRWLWAVVGIVAIVAVAVAIIVPKIVPLKPGAEATVVAPPVVIPTREWTQQAVDAAHTTTETPKPTETVRPANTSAISAEARPTVGQAVRTSSCDYGGELKAIEALDDLTVRFTLCYPDVGFPAKVALPSFGIHPAEYLVATGGTGSLLDAPIGTGPYRLSEWRKGSEIRLKANPDYWGERAKIPQIHFHWNDDADERLGYLKTGDILGMDNPAPQSYTDIQNNTDLKLYPREGLNTSYLGISDTASPFDDVRIRQAVALAIDRESLVSQSYLPNASVASYFAPCAIPNGCAGEAWYSFDADKARQLLAEAGYPDGFETELFFRDMARSDLPDPAGMAQDIADMLAKYLNIRVTLRAMKPAELIEATSAGKLPLYLTGWISDYPDPVNFLSPFYGEFSTQRFRAGFPDIWEILDRAATTASPEIRYELYAQANDLIKRNVPAAPLVHTGSATAFRASVNGAHSSPLHLESFAAMSLKTGSTLIWKQAAAPESLYCADETDPDTLRACAQITESLLAFQVGGAKVIPALAERYEWSEDLKIWTFHLRPDVKFHDGSALDASDVVTSWGAQWDAASPLHRGRTGEFAYFTWLFEQFLNASG